MFIDRARLGLGIEELAGHSSHYESPVHVIPLVAASATPLADVLPPCSPLSQGPPACQAPRLPGLEQSLVFTPLRAHQQRMITASLRMIKPTALISSVRRAQSRQLEVGRPVVSTVVPATSFLQKDRDFQGYEPVAEIRISVRLI